MEDDGEADSQVSEVAGSLSWWMMKNLWHESVPDKKLRLSLVDTILLQDGHVLHWFFTSSKSGSVLKRANKRLEWDGMVKFLIQHARSTGGEGKAAKDASCAFSAQVIATGRRLREGRTYPVMLTVPDLMSLREKHNAHLLDEIVAIQPFLAKNPFTGCGLFETEFERKGCKRTAQAALGTYELLRWPEEDVRWFDDNFDPSCNADTFNRPAARGGATFAQQRRKHGSAKRVHGVLHRMLATTTKQIVEHVERETDEVLLKVVAQFAFRPGSGQPTLLWLDSVHTVRSTSHYDDHTTVGIIDPHSDFTQLTRELGEEGSTSRSWTTFFPPKIADITSGGGSSRVAATGACLSTEGQRSEFLRKRMEGSFQAEVTFKDAPGGSPERSGPIDPAQAEGLREEKYPPENGGVSTATPNEARGGLFDQPGETDEQGGNKIIIPNDEESEHTRSNNDSDDGGGYQRQRGGHFTLPTEAWAHRSTAGRGLYFSRTGGGCGDQPVTEQWPRKRSTGTTMRRDGPWDRMDLRSAAENQRRPWTSPTTTQAAGTGSGMMGAGNGAVGVGTITHRLASTNGCYGDYCHYEGMWSTHRDSSGNNPAAGRGGCRAVDNKNEAAKTLASKLVSYRSILKCRAEEEALSSLSPSSLSSSKAKAKAKAKAATRSGGRKNGGQSDYLPTLGGSSSEMDRRHPKAEGKKANLAPVIAERMRLLAASLSDQGGGQYFSLGSSDRATVGVPEAAQRAVEELLYEKVLSHLHPTTVSRSVAVCDTCAMVYGYMDTYRKQTKRIKAASSETTRVARIAVSRATQRDRRWPQQTATSEDRGFAPPLLRRYSDLHLELSAPAPSATPPTTTTTTTIAGTQEQARRPFTTGGGLYHSNGSTVNEGTKSRGGYRGGGAIKNMPNKSGGAADRDGRRRTCAAGCDGRTRTTTTRQARERGGGGGGGGGGGNKSGAGGVRPSKPQCVPAFLV